MPRSAVAAKVLSDMKSASFIREMFERGRKLKAEFGPANVFDFSLGNPSAPPPPEFFAAVRAVAADEQPALHRYMPNAGFDDARAAVARFVAQEYGCPFDGQSILLTSGAAGAVNLLMRATLDPGDEVIVLAPYFPEYRFYIEQAGGVMVVVDTDRSFQPTVAEIEQALSPRTRALIICSPNNPTGAVYSQAICDALAAMLDQHDRDDRPIYLICDDVYRRLIYDTARCPTPVNRYRRAVIASSFSKDLSIAGERVGYVALPAQLPERTALLGALTMLNRTLGYVNTAAFMQRVITRCATARCDLSSYRENRDLLCSGLRDIGYKLPTPGGAMYAFPQTPIPDDLAFSEILLQHNILAVPGRGFGRTGYMRLSYCVDRATILGSLPGFRAALADVESRRGEEPHSPLTAGR